MELLKELLAEQNPFSGKKPKSTITQAREKNMIKQLEKNDKELLDLIEKMKKSVDIGEYDAAKMLAADFAKLSTTTNTLANHLADIAD